MPNHELTTNPTTAPATGAPAPADPAALNLRDAYEKTLPTALALEEGTLLPVNVDLPSAVNTAVGSLPRILALRDTVKEELPKFDLSNFDLLEQFALASAHAHGQYLSASAPPAALLKLNEQAIATRDMLYNDAHALAGRGLINGDRLGEFKSNVGYKNVTYDLIGLAALLKQYWPTIAGKTAIQMSELDEAEALAGKLISALSTREQTPNLVADVAAQRQRNFTLFAQAYNEVRRALSYLRWNNDDLERVAPSLYGGRTSKQKDDPSPHPSPSPSPTPAPTPPVTAGPTTLPASKQRETFPTTLPDGSPVPVGHPGSNPFADMVR